MADEVSTGSTTEDGSGTDDGSSTPVPTPPLLRVVSPDATPEEIAAALERGAERARTLRIGGAVLRLGGQTRVVR